MPENAENGTKSSTAGSADDGTAGSADAGTTGDVNAGTTGNVTASACMVTIKDEGEATFGAITFENAGTYRYTVREEKGSEAGYTYDETIHTVEVTVTDKGGVLSADWTADGEKTDGLTFTNTYEPPVPDKNGRITVKKEVLQEGKPLSVFYTFYTALFADEALTKRVSDVKPIELVEEDTRTVTFENLPMGTYYVAETDEKGNPIKEALYIESNEIINGKAELTPEHPSAESTIINYVSPLIPRYMIETEEETEIETEIATETESETEVLTEAETEEPKPQDKKTPKSVKTGDGTPILMWY